MKKRCCQNICAFTKSHTAPVEKRHIRHAPHKFEKGPFALVGNQRGRKLARLSVSQSGHLSSQIKGHLTDRLLYFNVHADDQRTGCFSPQQGLKNQDTRRLCVIMFPAQHSCGLNTDDLPWLSWFKCSGGGRSGCSSIRFRQTWAGWVGPCRGWGFLF